MVKCGWNFIIPFLVLGTVFEWQSRFCFHVELQILGWVCYLLAIFCVNVFNVHVQRNPFTVPTHVEGTRYFAGKFLAASVPKASLENEQHWIRLRSVDGAQIIVKQIAGLIARRIVSWVRPEDLVQGGQHIGLIQFGSQVDLLIPRSWSVKVKIGDKVCGGETVMAQRPLRKGKA